MTAKACRGIIPRTTCEAQMRVLIFNSDDYMAVEQGPHNHHLRQPLLRCGLEIEALDFSYNAPGAAIDETGAIEAARRFRPDVIVYNQAGYGRNLSAETFAAIRAMGAPIICAIYDTTTIKDRQALALFAACDVFLTYDSIYSFVEFALWSELAYRGAKRVYFPGGHFFTDLVASDPVAMTHDVVFAGSRTGIRDAFLKEVGEALAVSGIKLTQAGGVIEGSSETPRTSAAFLPIGEFFQTLRRARIVLNCQSEPFREQVKGRIFETLAAGSLCLTDRRPDVERMFPADTIETYASPAECVAKIRALLADEPRRAAIAARGRQWFEQNFDYKAFWSALLLSTTGAAVEVPQLPVLGEELTRTRAALGLIEPQFLHLIRLARELSVNGLTSRADAPFLTVGSLVSTHPEIQGRIDDATLGIGLFDGPGGVRAAMLAGWGLYRA
jgi:hypothetical protein